MWGLVASFAGSAITSLFSNKVGTAVVSAGAGYVAGKTSQRSKLEEWIGFSMTPFNIAMLVGGLLAVVLFYKWAVRLVAR